MPTFLITVSSVACATSGGTGDVNFEFSSLLVDQTYEAEIYNVDYSDSVAVDADTPATFYDVPNGVYTLRITSSPNGASSSKSVTVNCPVSPSCDLSVTGLTIVAPTSIGGNGYIDLTINTTAPGALSILSISPPGDPTNQLAAWGGRTAGFNRLLNIPAGDYQLNVQDSNGCTYLVPFNLPAFSRPGCTDPLAINYDPAATDDDGSCIYSPPRFYPVGGVLPNPVPLAIPAALVVGRWIEVELIRAGQTVAFAGGRVTQRAADQLFDAAPYLRSELAPLAATGNVPVIRDADACIEFWYRFRTHDADGTVGDWIESLNPRRFAVLAATPEVADGLTNYIADPTGEAPGTFLSALLQPVQFYGYQLSIAVLIPPGLPTPAYMEYRYYDGAGTEIEIRTTELPTPIMPGYWRFNLPLYPLPCAVRLEAQLTDTNRAYTGTCPVDAGPGTTDPGGYIIANGGYLKV